MQGIDGSIKLEWHHNVTVTDLEKITKSQKSATSSSTLDKLVLVTTRHIKIHGFTLCKDGMKMLLYHVDMMPKR